MIVRGHADGFAYVMGTVTTVLLSGIVWMAFLLNWLMSMNGCSFSFNQATGLELV